MISVALFSFSYFVIEFSLGLRTNVLKGEHTFESKKDLIQTVTQNGRCHFVNSKEQFPTKFHQVIFIFKTSCIYLHSLENFCTFLALRRTVSHS